MSTARFDIVAKLPDAASRRQARLMLRRLLADRFGITVHRESREMPGYALTVGPRGSKLKESKGPVKGDPDDPRKGASKRRLKPASRLACRWPVRAGSEPQTRMSTGWPPCFPERWESRLWMRLV